MKSTPALSMAGIQSGLPEGRWVRELAALEARLHDHFADAFHQPSSLVVHVTPEPGRPVASGRFQSLDVGFENGFLDIIALRYVQIRFYEPAIDMQILETQGSVEFVQPPRTDMRLTIQEESLNRILEMKQGDLKMKEARLNLEDGQIHFTGRIKTLFLENKLKVKGNLMVTPTGELNFQPSALSVGVIPLPQAMIAGIARRANPLFDLGNLNKLLGIVVNLDSIDIEPGQIVISTPAARHWRPHGS